jgi:uncharacterized protein (TIGR03435 family)
MVCMTEWTHVTRLMVTGAVVIGTAVSVLAQTGLTEAAFEVATIKRNVSGAENWALNPRPTGQFTVTNGSLASIVQAAFLVQDYQLEGLPAWTRNERYDIVAKLDAAIAARSQPDGFDPTWALALRSLVIERLKLAFHRATVQKPVYALVRARRDGTLGPNIKPAEFDCDALREQAVATARRGGAAPSPNSPDRVRCGMRSSNGRILYGGSKLDEFRAALSRMVGRAVLDRTNLEGRWDFELTYATEAELKGGSAANPDIFTALVEQLGLKLESTSGPVDVVVVDRIERPAAD